MENWLYLLGGWRRRSSGLVGIALLFLARHEVVLQVRVGLVLLVVIDLVGEDQKRVPRALSKSGLRREVGLIGGVLGETSLERGEIFLDVIAVLLACNEGRGFGPRLLKVEVSPAGRVVIVRDLSGGCVPRTVEDSVESFGFGADSDVWELLGQHDARRQRILWTMKSRWTLQYVVFDGANEQIEDGLEGTRRGSAPSMLHPHVHIFFRSDPLP